MDKFELKIYDELQHFGQRVYHFQVTLARFMKYNVSIFETYTTTTITASIVILKSLIRACEGRGRGVGRWGSGKGGMKKPKLKFLSWRESRTSCIIYGEEESVFSLFQIGGESRFFTIHRQVRLGLVHTVRRFVFRSSAKTGKITKHEPSPQVYQLFNLQIKERY